MPLSTLQSRFANLSDREKILAVALIAILCITMAAVAFGLVKMKTDDLEATIDGNARVLDELKEKKTTLSEQLQKKQLEEARFEIATPPLLGLLEKLAGEAGMEIPESRDLPDETIAKKWVHRSAEIRLRKIGLETLVHLMVKIRNENRTYPLAITKLNIKKRAGEPNSYDVQMTVSTYSKPEKAKSSKQKTKEKTREKKPAAGESFEKTLPQPTEFGAGV